MLISTYYLSFKTEIELSVVLAFYGLTDILHERPHFLQLTLIAIHSAEH